MQLPPREGSPSGAAAVSQRKQGFASPRERAVHGDAGFWREQRGNQPPAFSMLTSAPGADVQPFHNRQVAVLRPQDWKAWIYLERPKPNSSGRSLRAR
jgi:putative SOS response-associated peptidase YedK